MAKKKSPAAGSSPPSPDPEKTPADSGPVDPVAEPQPEPQPKPKANSKGKFAASAQAEKAAARQAKLAAADQVRDETRELMRSKAIELVVAATESPDPRQRVKLAREATKFDPDCAEAFILLAEQEHSRKTQLGLFEQAVGAAERALGPEFFEGAVGHFWGLLETRSYMRARAGLAESTWTSGRRDEAVDHLVDMLRLNPGDNQGLRYVLAGWFLNLERLDDLVRLLDAYDEDSATWRFTRALVAFRRGGDTPKARKLLGAARKANKHVADFLVGRNTLPSEPPPYYSPGDPNDAILYVANHLASWKATPGALTWVREVTAPKKPKAKPRVEAEPVSPPARELLDLPAEVDIWQADCRQFSRRIEIAGERVRPWMVLVASQTREMVVGHAMLEAEPTAAALWKILAGAMAHPVMGDPHRPSEIQIRPGSTWVELEALLEAMGVACAPTDPLDQINFLFENLVKHLEGVSQPGILDMPAVTKSRVARFYEIAAAFYLRAPWRQLGYEAIIQVECDRYESGPWYAVVMGQSGLTLGIALYEDLTLLRRMYAGKLTDEEGARRTVALTVTFDDDASLSEADLEAIEANGWPVASPEGYPSFFRKERGLSMRPPLAWEIDLMVACLTAIPDFIARRPIDDTTRELVVVPDAGGTPLELTLAWVPEPR